jgi:NAD(P)-dependent dehydrogenase (short-subunit alcohol dehydrogenase family)
LFFRTIAVCSNQTVLQPMNGRLDVLLENKNAVIYGAGEALCGAVARAFAREGARVFLAGRSRELLKADAASITVAGGNKYRASVGGEDD